MRCFTVLQVVNTVKVLHRIEVALSMPDIVNMALQRVVVTECSALVKQLYSRKELIVYITLLI